MTPEDLATIRAEIAYLFSACSGPWQPVYTWTEEKDEHYTIDGPAWCEEEADFLATSRERILALADALEAAWVERDDLTREYSDAVDYGNRVREDWVSLSKDNDRLRSTVEQLNVSARGDRARAERAEVEATENAAMAWRIQEAKVAMEADRDRLAAALARVKALCDADAKAGLTSVPIAVIRAAIEGEAGA